MNKEQISAVFASMDEQQKAVKEKTITPEEVFEWQTNGYKFIRLSTRQAEEALQAEKAVKHISYFVGKVKHSCVGVMVKVSDLINIAL